MQNLNAPTFPIYQEKWAVLFNREKSNLLTIGKNS